VSAKRPVTSATAANAGHAISELGFTLTTKLTGIRPDRLNNIRNGTGKTSAAEARAFGKLARNADELGRAVDISRKQGRGVKQANQGAYDLWRGAAGKAKRSRKQDVDIFATLGRMGIPASGPASVYLERGRSRAA
jgi:hypothetical protein